MANIDEQILRATKEIVVKFIENGRISPTGFHETFESIYETVEKTAKASIKDSNKEAKEVSQKGSKKEGKGKKDKKS